VRRDGAATRIAWYFLMPAIMRAATLLGTVAICAALQSVILRESAEWFKSLPIQRTAAAPAGQSSERDTARNTGAGRANVHSEMKSRTASNAHRMRQPIGMRVTRGSRGFIERLSQEIIA